MQLDEHRLLLLNNTNYNTHYKEKAISNFVKMHASKAYPKSKNKILLLNKAAEMVWNAQEEKPMFDFILSDGLPAAWNRPQGFADNYIRYEIGHIVPRNAGGESKINNLCFMSARCNQHIQSSLSMDSVIEGYFSHNDEVLQRWENLKDLWVSQEWLDLEKDLTQHRDRGIIYL